MRGKNVLKIDTVAILSDAKDQAQAELILRGILNSLKAAEGNYILFVEDISFFAKDNPAFGADVAKSLRQLVESGKIQILANSTNRKL